MRLIILILICVANCNIYAQVEQICGNIEYTQSTHFSRDFSRDFTLIFNNYNSIYIENNILTKKETINERNDDVGRQFDRDISRSNHAPEFVYNDRLILHFMEVWFDKELLVKEDSLVWQWDLKKEVKKIGDFNCQRATTQFRGREYTAWFTQEIPVFYGPWKFQGLSGLILEVYDSDMVFHIVAKKVNIRKQRECKINVDKSNFNTALSIKQYLKEKVDLIKKDFAKLSSRLPKGYDPLIYDENCNDCREEVEIFYKK